MAPVSASDTQLVRTVIKKLVEHYFPDAQPERFTDNVHRVIGVDDHAQDNEHFIRVFFPVEGKSEATNPTFVTANFTIPNINTLEDEDEGVPGELSTKEQACNDLLADLNKLICGNENGSDIVIQVPGVDNQMHPQPRPKIRVSAPQQHSDVHILIYGSLNELASSIRRNVQLNQSIGKILSNADISLS